MTLAPRVRADKRDVIPAAVHVDGTGRIQTVERSANPRYYGLIEEFGRLTGVPVLLNTSFNRKEPIVARPEDAIACYLESGMDVLVLGDFYTTDRGSERLAHVEHAADCVGACVGRESGPRDGHASPASGDRRSAPAARHRRR